MNLNINLGKSAIPLFSENIGPKKHERIQNSRHRQAKEASLYITRKITEVSKSKGISQNWNLII